MSVTVTKIPNTLSFVACYSVRETFSMIFMFVAPFQANLVHGKMYPILSLKDGDRQDWEERVDSLHGRTVEKQDLVHCMSHSR